MDDLAGHRVRERDVGADVEPEPDVGPRRRRRAPRVDDEEARAVATPLRRWWKKIGCVSRAFEPQRRIDVRLLDLPIGRRAAARSEHRRQTDDAGRVSGAVAAVDVVRAHDLARELLGEEVHLVRRLRAREDPEGRRRVRRASRGRRPSAARSSASSQVAGRRPSPSRTSGVVRRPFVAALIGSLQSCFAARRRRKAT